MALARFLYLIGNIRAMYLFNVMATTLSKEAKSVVFSIKPGDKWMVTFPNFKQSDMTQDGVRRCLKQLNTGML